LKKEESSYEVSIIIIVNKEFYRLYIKHYRYIEEIIIFNCFWRKVSI